MVQETRYSNASSWRKLRKQRNSNTKLSHDRFTLAVHFGIILTSKKIDSKE
jgi:hypothetical protein|tara:strand:+ start:590 stop:742 length:153 start_codon:yes stop_codon:yes gene_type:complete